MRPLLIGLNSASEQFTPLELIERGLGAHRAGFDSFWVSDHFHPWFHTGAHSSFAWEVIAAMTARSDRLVMGTSVTAPLFRYSPAIVAQAFSTLSYLAPGRVWLGMATGEGLNEVPCGYQWPRSHAERIRRLREATIVIRLLWTKEFVTFKGEYYSLNEANLYDKPQIPIPIHISAFGPRSAELAGELGDGLMTVGPMDPTKAREVLFPAVEKGARLSGRRLDDVEKSMVLGLGFHAEREKAIDALLPWRGSMLPVFADSEVHDPRVIEENRESRRKGFDREAHDRRDLGGGGNLRGRSACQAGVRPHRPGPLRRPARLSQSREGEDTAVLPRGIQRQKVRRRVSRPI